MAVIAVVVLLGAVIIIVAVVAVVKKRMRSKGGKGGVYAHVLGSNSAQSSVLSLEALKGDTLGARGWGEARRRGLGPRDSQDSDI
ncbi:RT1 class I histocompatibility antigen, AA alpha chain-like [Alexandromys fortis]|nr:RT1 class I histocompatibility antigen, AA alpha chain-like [Microtus fortis]